MYIALEIAVNIVYVTWIVIKYTVIYTYKGIKLCIRLVKKAIRYYKKRKRDKLKRKLIMENNLSYIQDGKFTIVRENGKFKLKIGGGKC